MLFRSEAQVHALKGVSFNLAINKFFVIYGPSGSGKSTLLTILAGLNHPDGGEVMVDEISLYKDLDSERLALFRSEYIGFVFQAFNLIPYLNVIENVMLPLANKKKSSKEKYRMAEHALEKVMITDQMKKLPGEISGGQAQRVAIARAIVNEPPIILADEPTGNLDSYTKKEIMHIFQSLIKVGHSIVMVSHDPENIKMADESIQICDGIIQR